MSDLYSQQHRALQAAFDSIPLADAVHNNIVTTEIDAQSQAFIESRDFFFLSTVDHRGYPTCSYKGGYPGFLSVIDSQTLAFPSFNGNGMFLSMGNINANSHIGLLLIDFETPHRLRIHGNASIDRNDPLLTKFREAELIVRIKLTELFINCPRYIHPHKRIATSKYVPQSHCQTPVAQWKRIDNLQTALPEKDRNLAANNGGTITTEQYIEMITKGEG